MSNVEQLVDEENRYRQQMREAVEALEQELQRCDNSTEEYAHLQERLHTLTSKLREMQLPPSSKPISLERIVHLREIFTHYCTHIFRVGKHMTFERLEYEKVHMTLDRFFVLLRDFRLTTISVDGRTRELVPKVKIMNIFKKVSSNAQDITFEEFIECLERIAVLHYDESHFVADNKPENRAATTKKKISRPAKEHMQARQRTPQSVHTQAKEEDNQEPKEGTQQNDPSSINPRHEEDNEVGIELPAESTSVAIQHEEPEDVPPEKVENGNSFEPADLQIQKQPEQPAMPDLKPSADSPFIVPKSVKIQVFYKLIGVDNASDYRKKLGELNLPTFKSAHTRKFSSIQLGQPPQTELTDNVVSNEEQLRMKQIKQRIEEQKAIDIVKRKSPKKPPDDTSQTDYYRILEEKQEKRQREKQRIEQAKRAKKELDEELERKLLQLPPPPPSKRLLNAPSYKATNVTWDDLQRMNFEQVVRRDAEFQPHLLYELDADDEQYMGQLRFDPTTIQKHRQLARHSSIRDIIAADPTQQRASQLAQLASQRQKKASSLVDSTKKRAIELARQEKHRETAANRKSHAKTRFSRQQL